MASAFRAHSIQVRYNEKSASELFIELLPLINSAKVSMLDHPKLITQPYNLERRNSRSLASP